MNLTPEHEHTIALAIKSLRVSSDHEVFWFDEPVDRVRALPDGSITETLTASVSGLLYRAWYVYGRPRRDLDIIAGEVVAKPPSQSPRFIRSVIAANRAPHTRFVNLPLSRTTSGEFAIVSGVRVETSQLNDSLIGADGIRLDVSGVSVTKSPGFVLFTAGDWWSNNSDTDAVMRVYWNVTRIGALALVERLTEELTALGLIYQLKVIHSDRRWPERADTAVLYMTRSDLTAAWPRLAAIRGQIEHWLRPYVPALTTRLAPGVGLAEDPGGGDSYGTFLSSELASEIVSAVVERGQQDCSGFLQPSLHRLGASRLFGPGSATARVMAEYQALDEGRPPGLSPISARVTDHWLAKAYELGVDLMSHALWYDDRCTWLCLEPIASDKPSMCAVDATLYQGTAGIGWALAQLYRATGNPALQKHALGAIRQSLHAARTLAGGGLYTGQAGIGLAAAMCGRWLNDPELYETGTRVVRDAATRSLTDAEAYAAFDLIDGAAGIILALIGIDRLGGASGLLDLAGDLATRVVREAVESDSGGLRWLDRGRGDEVGFVGLGHGASGPGLALALLAETTEESSWTAASAAAARYEREWLDPAVGNWKDSRIWLEGAGEPHSGRSHGLFRFDWCYGTPGILLSRLGLERVADDRKVADDVHAAVHWTRTAAADFPRFGHAVGICHGAAGMAEVLSLLPSRLRHPDDSGLIDRLTSIAVSSATLDMVEPGLMMGAAGAVCAALRRHCDSVISPALMMAFP